MMTPAHGTAHDRSLRYGTAPVEPHSQLPESSLPPPHAKLVRDSLRLFEERPINTISLCSTLDAGTLLTRFPERPLYVCDAYVAGIERGHLESYGLVHDNIVNIDHHADIDAMARRISSGNLADEYVRLHGPLTGAERVIIHHTDCDSVISALLLRGLLPRDPLFTDAVIAADHTAEPHPVADLLQALSSERDLRFSTEELTKLLRREPLSPRAQELLQILLNERAEAFEVVRAGAFIREGGVAWACFDHTVEGSYFPALIPEAEVIVLGFPHRADPRKWVVRTRLGNCARAGATLLGFNITSELDETWGGRWNAGSNSRGGGSDVHPGEYVKFIAKKLATLPA